MKISLQVGGRNVDVDCQWKIVFTAVGRGLERMWNPVLAPRATQRSQNGGFFFNLNNAADKKREIYIRFLLV
jgi:hypothetical protein